MSKPDDVAWPLRARQGIALILTIAAVGTASFLLSNSVHSENLVCASNVTFSLVDVRRMASSATVNADVIKNHQRPILRHQFNSRFAYQAIQEAIREISTSTPFTFIEAEKSEAEDQWKLLVLGETTVNGITSRLAGRTLFNGSDNPLRPLTVGSCTDINDGIITSANYYYNGAHFFVSLGDYQCTAIHEFLHGLGLEHNDDTGSVMRQTDKNDNFVHSDRCHGSDPTIALGRVDIEDIDALYGE